MATKKFLDYDGLVELVDKIEEKYVPIIEGKVDKVAGKGLSTNDYTTAEKTKLAGIDDYANYIAVDSVITSVRDNPVKGSVMASLQVRKIRSLKETMQELRPLESLSGAIGTAMQRL